VIAQDVMEVENEEEDTAIVVEGMELF